MSEPKAIGNPHQQATHAQWSVEYNYCKCHPETCCCSPYKLLLNGEFISSGSEEGMNLLAQKLATYTAPPVPIAGVKGAASDTERLDYIERTFSGMTNRERYLPVQMIWGKGANGRTLREACDKYMARDAGKQVPP